MEPKSDLIEQEKIIFQTFIFGVLCYPPWN